MKKLVLGAFVALGIIILILVWAPWKSNEPTQDMTDQLRRQAQVAVQQEVIDSLKGQIRDDSIRDAGSTQRAKSRVASLAQRVDSLRPIPVAPDTASRDTVDMVLIHRDDRSWTVPKFVLDLVIDQQTALKSDTLALQNKDQMIADQRATIFMQMVRITSADSTIAVRDKRIGQLTKRRWQDYLALGCGYGIKGADCLAGVRVPF